MVKVAIYPPNSLVLADLIERKGHTPLALQKQIRQKIIKMIKYLKQIIGKKYMII